MSRARDDVTTKKPHSAKRKVAAFYIQYKKYLKNRAYMPGENVKGQLKKYDTIFFNGNRRRDVPALKYTIVYGVHTKGGQGSTRVTGVSYRRKARSKYGLKHEIEEPVKIPVAEVEESETSDEEAIRAKEEAEAAAAALLAQEREEALQLRLSLFIGGKFEKIKRLEERGFFKKKSNISKRWEVFKALTEKGRERGGVRGEGGGKATLSTQARQFRRT